MKRRYLQPKIEGALTTITLFELLLGASINDFTLELNALLLISGLVISVLFNIYVLFRWGKSFNA